MVFSVRPCRWAQSDLGSTRSEACEGPVMTIREQVGGKRLVVAVVVVQAHSPDRPGAGRGRRRTLGSIGMMEDTRVVLRTDGMNDPIVD